MDSRGGHTYMYQCEVCDVCLCGECKCEECDVCLCCGCKLGV